MIRINLPDGEFKRLNEMLSREANRINKQALEGLYSVGMNVLADSQANLSRNESIATSKLINSGSVKRQPDNSVDVIYDADYAFWVEKGRKSGTPPPIKPILEWIKKKGIVDTYSIRTRKQTKRGADFLKRATTLAFLIARSIGQNGTKAKPFLYPAFRKNEAAMMRVLNNVIR